MTTLIYAPIALWEGHLSIAIELCYLEVDLGNSVLMVNCRESLASCAANPFLDKAKCNECKIQSRHLKQELLPFGVKNLFIEGTDVSVFQESLPQLRLDSLEDLERFQWDGFNFGLAALSHMSTMYRKSEPLSQDEIFQARNLLINSLSHYLFFCEKLPKNIDKVLLWGGRRPSEAPMAFFAKKRGIPLFYFESAASDDSYYLSSNQPSHPLEISNEIMNWSQDCSKSRGSRSTAADYFKALEEGVLSAPGYRSYPMVEKTLNLPKKLDKKRIVIFTSTAWEWKYSHVRPEIDKSEFWDMHATIEKICLDEELARDFEVIVRWHPNTSSAHKSDKARVQEIILNSGNGVEHFSYDSQINSYVLLNSADIVITMGSSIGVEACFRSKPVILLGQCDYSNLGVAYEPRNYDEFRVLLNSSLVPLDNTGAVMWANYRQFHGIKMRFVSSEDGKKCLNGKRIKKKSPFAVMRNRFNIAKHKIKNLTNSQLL
jgi:hypothetical protein